MWWFPEKSTETLKMSGSLILFLFAGKCLSEMSGFNNQESNNIGVHTSRHLVTLIARLNLFFDCTG